MDWNCVQTEQRLSDYLDRAMSAEETAALVAHVKDCSDCAALVAGVEATVRAIHATPDPEVPPHLFAKIIGATSGARASGYGWPDWLRNAPLIWSPRFAMGALTMAASLLIVLHAANAPGNSEAFASINPMNLVRAADRQVHRTYAHTAKFVSDLRLVYEIESRLQPESEPTGPQQPPAPAPSEAPPQSNGAPRPYDHAARSREIFASAIPGDLLLPVPRSNP
jgi:hypothetical protein